MCIFRWQTILTRVSPPSQKTIYNFKLVVGHTTKHMTHSCSWEVEIWWPSVENVTLGLCPRVTFSTSGSHISMPAFAAACRDHQPLAVQQSIDISCSLGPQQQTCFSGLWWPGEMDRLTDARQLYGPCSAYFVGSANKQLHAIIAIYPSFSILGAV